MQRTPLIIETDIGHDADDVFALLYFLAVGAPIKAVLVSPGDHYQVAIVRALLSHFGVSALVLTPAAQVSKQPVLSRFHKFLLDILGWPYEATPDGHETLLPHQEDVELFLCGPVKMAQHLKPTNITMQGGFVPYSRHPPQITLAKFVGKKYVPTFNLGGTSKDISEHIISLPVPHRWVGKNVCHTQVYTPEIHEKCPMFSSQAGILFRRLIEEYFVHRPGKAFHDPLAALLHYQPELGLWVDEGPIRLNGQYSSMPMENHKSLIGLATPDGHWQAFWSALAGNQPVQPSK